MNKYIFYYEVNWYLDEKNNEEFSKGFLIADSYTDAATQVDRMYEVYDMKLKMIGEGSVIEIPEDIEFDLEVWEEKNGF